MTHAQQCQNSALLYLPSAWAHGTLLFWVHFQCNTYGKWQVFSSRYRHQLCYSFLNKQQLRYKSTHSLPHCHSHRSQKYKTHNMVLGSPMKIPIDLLPQMYLLQSVLMRERALNFWHSPAVPFAEPGWVCDRLGLSWRSYDILQQVVFYCHLPGRTGL